MFNNTINTPPLQTNDTSENKPLESQTSQVILNSNLNYSYNQESSNIQSSMESFLIGVNLIPI